MHFSSGFGETNVVSFNENVLSWSQPKKKMFCHDKINLFMLFVYYFFDWEVGLFGQWDQTNSFYCLTIENCGQKKKKNTVCLVRDFI